MSTITWHGLTIEFEEHAAATRDEPSTGKITHVEVADLDEADQWLCDDPEYDEAIEKVARRHVFANEEEVWREIQERGDDE